MRSSLADSSCLVAGDNSLFSFSAAAGLLNAGAGKVFILDFMKGPLNNTIEKLNALAKSTGWVGRAFEHPEMMDHKVFVAEQANLEREFTVIICDHSGIMPTKNVSRNTPNTQVVCTEQLGPDTRMISKGGDLICKSMITLCWTKSTNSAGYFQDFLRRKYDNTPVDHKNIDRVWKIGNECTTIKLNKFPITQGRISGETRELRENIHRFENLEELISFLASSPKHGLTKIDLVWEASTHGGK